MNRAGRTLLVVERSGTTLTGVGGWEEYSIEHSERKSRHVASKGEAFERCLIALFLGLIVPFTRRADQSQRLEMETFLEDAQYCFRKPDGGSRSWFDPRVLPSS
jgi:hypothetical protein